jgi:hypothetical protein
MLKGKSLYVRKGLDNAFYIFLVNIKSRQKFSWEFASENVIALGIIRKK